MGIKRPLEVEFEEASFKQAKQFVSDDKRTTFIRPFSSCDVSQPDGGKGEGEDGFDKSHIFNKEFRDEKIDDVLDLAFENLETSAPLSSVTRSSSSCEEVVGYVEPFYLPVYQEYFNFPRRTVVQFEDAYSALLNSSPRKKVPIGPDHQADIPEWSPDTIQKESGSCSHSIDDKREQNLLGTPVVPISNSDKSSFGDKKIAQGREDCECLDEGSMRCVQQHIKEARNKLKVELGEMKFADMGFYEMGEGLAFRWTEEEEKIFHDIIFSNPQSLGKNFWGLLSAAFPSRTKMEIVSYYFNVFMLRRRAIQNRSNFLEIDSDDDEWHGTPGGFDSVGEDEGEDSVIDSFADQGLRGEGSDDENYEEEDDDDDDDDDDEGSDDGEGDGEFGNGDTISNAEDASEEHNPSRHHHHHHHHHQTSKSQQEKPFSAAVSSDLLSHNDDGTVQDDSSFDSVIEAADDDAQSREICDLNQYSSAGEGNLSSSSSSNDGSSSTNSVFLLENSDALIWGDGSCSMVKVVDFLPTCNMIEEIFGPCSSKSTE